MKRSSLEVKMSKQFFKKKKVFGYLYVFGSGDFGQLGLGESVLMKYRPFPIMFNLDNYWINSRVNQVISGGMHTVVILEDNSVWSWGVNDEGALGRCTSNEIGLKYTKILKFDSYKPGRVELFCNIKVVQISAGDSHTCFLSESGLLYISGTFRNKSGVMGCCEEKCILLTPETLLQFISTISERIFKIVSGSNHVLALTECGNIYSWGSGEQGQLGRFERRISKRLSVVTQLVPAKAEILIWFTKAMKIKDLTCGAYHSLLLHSDGKVVACGLNNYGQLGLISDFSILSLPRY